MNKLSTSLRQKAENQMKEKHSVNADLRTDGDYAKLFHELQISQIELEMQNEELLTALELAETKSALYDFAPAGYFTIDQDKIIIQLNLRGAEMIGKGRAELIGSHLGLFINQDTLPQFDEFIQQIFQTENIQTGKVITIQTKKLPVYLYLRGCLSPDLKNCLITAVDITQLKLAEDELLKRVANLEYFHKFTVGRELRMVELKKEINSLLKELDREQKYLLTE